jgi:hypothetical protein
MKRCVLRQNSLAKRKRYRTDSYGQRVTRESEQLGQNHGVCEGLLKSIGAQEGAAYLLRQVPSQQCRIAVAAPLGQADLTSVWLRRPGRIFIRPQVVERDLKLSDKVLWRYRGNCMGMPQGWRVRAANSSCNGRAAVVVGTREGRAQGEGRQTRSTTVTSA